MLLELRIENLLLIERAELRLGPGLNAITGETGAGKTILAHSFDLLMGGKARPQIVRPGADCWAMALLLVSSNRLPPVMKVELRRKLRRSMKCAKPAGAGVDAGKEFMTRSGEGKIGIVVRR